jgi:DNA-binding FrmR family transcriptional regulator
MNCIPEESPRLRMRRVLAAEIGALALVAEVIEDHIRVHVVDPARERNSAKARGAEELIDVVQAYLK